jgi:hypothetical protein
MRPGARDVDRGLEYEGTGGVLANRQDIFKYVDPFDQGLSGSGIYTDHDNIWLVDAGAHLTKYVYLELEFMDLKSPRDASVYQYKEMLDEETYFSKVAEQIAAGILEFLLLPQDQVTFDAIKFNGGTSIW